jgi:F0F1-type ATP synthase gamma subunit
MQINKHKMLVSPFPGMCRVSPSENASRLAAMQRAEKNSDELLEDLKWGFPGAPA